MITLLPVRAAAFSTTIVLLSHQALAFSSQSSSFHRTLHPNGRLLGRNKANECFARRSNSCDRQNNRRDGVDALNFWNTNNNNDVETKEEEKLSSAVTTTVDNSNSNDNPFASFMSSFMPSSSSAEVLIPKETEEEKLRRLAIEERIMLEEGELLRQERVKEDAIPYIFLLALQTLPFFGTDRLLSVIYFFGLATTTVYLGSRQVTLDDPELISQKNALIAPIGGSVFLFGLYLLLKNGIDPTGLYAIGATLFGAISISDIGVPILRNVLPDSFAKAEIKVPKPIANAIQLDPPTLPVDGLSTLVVGLLFAAIYWSPIALTQKFLVSNALAWALAMVSLGAISLGSFQTGALLLGGLFFYDIFWVFGADVMMTVATKVEAPIKFLFTAPPPPAGVEPTYPFAVLGLGDVVVPGIFVRFLSKMDSVLKPQIFSYFKAGTAAYAFGLASCFVVNILTHSGQPALLYLDPSIVGSALACGLVNGQLQEVWNFSQDVDDDDETKEEIIEIS